MVRGILFFFIVACLAGTAVQAQPQKVIESRLVACPLVWSADGSQVRQDFASSKVNCSYDARFTAARADFELGMLCAGEECTHVSKMNPEQRAHYRQLEVAPRETHRFPHVVCILRTPDDKAIRVAIIYSTVYNDTCTERNVIRTYYPEANQACMTEGGCIPLQYVATESNEYQLIARPKVSEEKRTRNDELERALSANSNVRQHKEKWMEPTRSDESAGASLHRSSNVSVAPAKPTTKIDARAGALAPPLPMRKPSQIAETKTAKPAPLKRTAESPPRPKAPPAKSEDTIFSFFLSQ